MSGPLPAKLSLRVFWLGVWIVIAGLGNRFGEPERDRPTPGREGAPFAGAPGGRVVVVVVDSMRAETAEDPAVMPWMAEARRRGLWGRLEPCANKFTVPCVRLMFEGYEPPFTVGLQDFTPVPVDEPSLFLRLKARGVRVGLIGDHTFPGIYGHLAERVVNDEKAPVAVERQDEWAVREFLPWLREGELQFLVLHLINTDSVSHEFHPGTPQYSAIYRETDGWLREIDEALGPRDHLIVLGDHGHDELGMHIPGLDVPAAYVAMGPLFAPGVRLDMGMASVYLLAGTPYGFDLPKGYEGQAPVAALYPDGGSREYAAFLADRLGMPPLPGADVRQLEARLGRYLVSVQRAWTDNVLKAFFTLLPWILGLLLALGSGGVPRRWLLVTMVGWGAAVVLPTFAAGWIALAVHAGVLWFRGGPLPWRWGLAALACAAFSFELGATGSRWTPIFYTGSFFLPLRNLAFVGVCVLEAAVLALLARRATEREAWWRVVVPFSAFAGLLLFGYMGVNYWGAGTLVPWAMVVAVPLLALHGARPRMARLGLALAALLPSLFTVTHETWALVWRYTLIASIGRGPLGHPGMAWVAPLLLHAISRRLAGERVLGLDWGGPLLLAAGSGAIALMLGGAPQWGVAGACAGLTALSAFVGSPADRTAARLAAWVALAAGFFGFPFGTGLAFAALALGGDAYARLAADTLRDSPRARALVLAALGAALAYVTAWIAVPAYRMGNIDFTFAWTVIWNSPVQGLRALQVFVLSLTKYFALIAVPAWFILSRCPDREAARDLVRGGVALLLVKVALQTSYICGDLLDPSARYRVTTVQELMFTTGAALSWSFSWAFDRVGAWRDARRTD
ncbi:MAG: alkaline phosphatase family protein [Deltaproteobacteria bacterium]|nr:alkaline phosphatase family protein [Deltaproteobacteria bacterium]